MKTQELYTNYLYSGKAMPENLAEKLEAMGFEYSSQDAYAYPSNAASSFDGVFVSWGERDDYSESKPYSYVEVCILHPEPFHVSQYWDKLAEVLFLFRGIKTMARWDWRDNARKKALKERARKEKLLAQGQFHVIQFNWNGRRDKTVFATNDPVKAYNMYIALPEVWDQDERCECKILHLSGETGGKIYEEYFWADRILRIYEWRPSPFEERFFIDPYTRCGPAFYERPYAYARRWYYNLMMGRKWLVCPAKKGEFCPPSITVEEKKIVDGGGMMYPIQPRLRDGSVISFIRSR